MAVSITVAEIAAAIRVGDTAEETAQITRLRATAIEVITQFLGATQYAAAPDVILDEAAIRLTAFWYDQPHVGRGVGNPIRSSGAGRLLLPYRILGVGTTGEAVAAAQEAVGTASNPVVDVSVEGSTLTVTFQDGTTRDETLPEGGGTLGLRETASETIDITAARTWTALSSMLPSSAVVGIQMEAPDGDETEIFLLRTAGLDGMAVAGETVAQDQRFMFDTSADGTVLFAATEIGNYTVRFFELAEAPAGTGTGTVDQVARDAAEAAQTAADAAAATANANTRPMPANPAEAAAGTSTTIRSWTSTLIRTAVNAVVATWARIGNTDALPADKIADGSLSTRMYAVDSVDHNALAADSVRRAAVLAEAIDAGKLDPAVVALLLPSGGVDGQFVGHSSGAPVWVGAPSAAGQWFEMGQVFSSGTQWTVGDAIDATLRADGMAVYADAAAVRAAVANGTIRQFALQRSDTEQVVVGINAPNFISGQSADYRVCFTFDGAETIEVRFTAMSITMEPQFDQPATTVRLDLAVFS